MTAPPDLTARFAAAQARIQAAASVSTTSQLELYGLYKQATLGDVTGSRPGLTDVRGRAKYDAWAARRGLSAEAAMTAYVDLVRRLAP